LLHGSMTNYASWDAKAAALCRDAEEEDKAEEAANNEALGLTEGVKGPTTEQADKELKKFDDHSTKRKDFIAWSKDREISLCHAAQEAPLVLDGPELQGKAVVLKGSKGVKYVIPEGSKILKLMADNCCNVSIQLEANLLTSTVELYKCEEFELSVVQPLGIVQVDECQLSVQIRFAENDHIGKIYHQNSPGLSVSWGFSGGDQQRTVGKAGAFQLVTSAVGKSLRTNPVRRGEGEYPLDLATADGETHFEQPEEEAVPAAEQRRLDAEKHRLAGNEMFRACDFAQAAAIYSMALEKDPENAAVWSNRSQCWLKLGQFDKALADATQCTKVDCKNPKGWFRKGMSLHAMERYGEAIPALLEAEKLEPANKQISDAIKMAQLKARKHG